MSDQNWQKWHSAQLPRAKKGVRRADLLKHSTLFDASFIAGLLVVAAALATLGLLGGWR